jgi:hypothetical protein
MINLPASALNNKWSKEDLDNSKKMAIHKKYEYHLEEAKKYKSDLLYTKSRINSGLLPESKIDEAKRFAECCKQEALKHWELSQRFLKEFESTN